MLYGLTIITHGYNSGIDGWVSEMANAIAEETGDASTVAQYSMVVERPGWDIFGEITAQPPTLDAGSPSWSNASSGEAILKLDWSDLDAGISASTSDSTVEIADVVADYLIQNQIDGYSIFEAPIHLTGHSRGASLNTRLVERFGELDVWVDQFSTLDPHPVDGENGDVVDFGDAPIDVWENVRFADNYYREDGANALEPFDVDGEQVDGAFNLQLDEGVLGGTFSPDAGYGLEHNDVHLWYHGTIDTSGDIWDGESSSSPVAANAGWYVGTMGPRTGIGYDFSRIRGSDRPAEGFAPRVDFGMSIPEANTWDNIEILDLRDDLTWQLGSNLALDVEFEDRDRDSTITVTLDDNANPYDNDRSLNVPVVSTDVSSIAGNQTEFVLPTNGMFAGTYHVFAEISNGNRTRYYYAPGTVEMVAASLATVVADGFDFPVGPPDHVGYHVSGWDYLDPNHPSVHPGEDWNGTGGGDSDLGDSVHAIGHGTVADVRSGIPGWGNIVLIHHQLPSGELIWSQYAHLRDVNVRKGDPVVRNQEIGTIGKGFNDEYDAHLHFEIRTESLAADFWPASHGWSAADVSNSYVDPTDFINANRDLPGGGGGTPTRLGIDRWWGTVGDPTPFDVTWTIELEAGNYYFDVDFDNLGHAADEEWKLVNGQVLVDGAPIALDQFNASVVPFTLEEGIHEFVIGGFQAPSKPSVQGIQFQLRWEVWGFADGLAHEHEALFVADRQEQFLDVTRPFVVDGLAQPLNGVDELIDYFAPVLHFSQGERYAVPFDVTAPQPYGVSEPMSVDPKPIFDQTSLDAPNGFSGRQNFFDLDDWAIGVYASANETITPAIYASIVEHANSAQLAINYYFHYPRSNWGDLPDGGNTHEADWEGVTLFLRNEGGVYVPDRLAMAQHVRMPLGIFLDAIQGQTGPIGDIALDLIKTQIDGVDVIPWSELYVSPTQSGSGQHVHLFPGAGGHATYASSGETAWLPGNTEIHRGDGIFDSADGSKNALEYVPDANPNDVKYLPRVSYVGGDAQTNQILDWLRYPGFWGKQDSGRALFTASFGLPESWLDPVFGDVSFGNDGIQGPVFGGVERWLDPWSWAAHAEPLNTPGATPTPDQSGPQAVLHLPQGSEITQSELNWEGYLDVSFEDVGASGIFHHTITDAGSEVMISGAGAGDAAISGTPMLASQNDGAFVYRYEVTGGFGVGDLTVTFPAGTFADRAGNVNEEMSQTITVLPPPPGADKIRWVNEDAITDALVWRENGNLVQVDGQFSPEKRAVIKEAIQIWNNILVDLNNGSNVFEVTFSGGNPGDDDLRGYPNYPVAAETIIRDDNGNPDVPGPPTKADIRLDNDGGDIGWFVDTSPSDNVEFPDVLAPYFLGGNGGGQRDMLSVVVHELGHALGISINYEIFRDHVVLQDGSPNPDPSPPPFPPGKRTYNPNGDPSATLSPLPSTHLDLEAHPFELMTDQTRDPGLEQAGLAAGQRALISPLTLEILEDSFGYEVFFPTFDTATGAWTIEALPSVSNDLVLSASDGTLRLTDDSVDGLNEVTRPLTGQGSLLINGNTGDDRLTIDFSAQNPVPDEGVIFDGGPQISSDSLVLTGGVFDQVLYRADPGDSAFSHAGAVLSIGGTNTSSVFYHNLEPITDFDTATDRTFVSNIPGPQQIRLHDDGDAANNMSLLDSNGAGLFEQINFVHPTNTFHVNAGTGNDQVYIETLDPGFGAQIVLNGESGDDTFHVTPSGSASIFVNGGDPLGLTPSDALVVEAAGAAVTFVPGPDADEGAIIVGSSQPITFDNIASVTINNAGDVTINGTNDDDHITVVGTGQDSLTVTVNDGPEIGFAGLTALTVLGLNGDDDVMIGLNDLSLGQDLSVVGGLSAGGTDRVTVTDIGSGATAFWTPVGVDEAVFSIGSQAVAVTGTEEFVLDGEGLNAHLIVSGTVNPDVIVHEPGHAFDAGLVQVESQVGSLLSISYRNLGTGGAVSARDAVPVEGMTIGEDTLVTFGTHGSDVLGLDFSAMGEVEVVLETIRGQHIPVRSADVENVRIDTLEGDDRIDVQADVELTGILALFAGGPSGGSDTLNVFGTIGADAATVDLDSDQITGLGGPIALSGFEHVNYDAGAVAAGDTLTVLGTVVDDVLLWKPDDGESGKFELEGAETDFTYRNIDDAYTIDLSSGQDVFSVEATIANDVIDLFQVAPSAVVDDGYSLDLSLGQAGARYTFGPLTIAQDLPGFAPNDAIVSPSVEEVHILAGRGNDLIRVGHDDEYADGDAGNGLATHMMRLAVTGDAPNASDRLIVQDDGTGDLVLVRQAPDDRSGRVTVAPAVNNALGDIVYDQIERLDIVPHDPVTGGTGDDLMGQIVVYQPDPFELNDDRLIPTDIEDVLSQHRDPTIDPGGVTDPFGDGSDVPGDEDWYEFYAPKIGTFRFDVWFTEIPTVPSGRDGLPGDGALDVWLYDASGNLIVAGTPTDDGQQVTFSAADDTFYYLRVNGFTADAINTYDVRLREVDLVGPQLYDPDGAGPLLPVHITDDLATLRDESEYDLFDLKPKAGPTPLVPSITVHLRDIVDAEQLGRAPGDVYPALDALIAGTEGTYSVVGDANGQMVIQDIIVTNNSTDSIPGAVQPGAAADSFAGDAALSDVDDFYNGQLVQFDPAGMGPLAGETRLVTDYDGATQTFTFASGFSVVPAAGTPFAIFPLVTATVELRFPEPLPDDRFTLSILESLRDPAGNLLDGESNASEPLEAHTYPTGDNVAGGTYDARFTVDSRPEVGIWAAGSVYADTNGNFLFDPQNIDAVNRDIVYTLAFASDDVFVGNFVEDPMDMADGFDKLAAYGRVGGQFRWLIDTDNDGVPNIVHDDPANINGLPVAGNFDGIAENGDEIGIFTGQVWHLDTNHDFLVDVQIPSNLAGYPVVGDFNGDTQDDLATWTDDIFRIDFDRDGQEDTRFNFGFIGVRERPVAADIDMDGTDDPGLWVPDRGGAEPRERGEWYFLVSDGRSIVDRIVPDPDFPGTNKVEFTPIPFDADVYATFGDEFGIPIVGNLDPPIAVPVVSDPDAPVLVVGDLPNVVEIGQSITFDAGGSYHPLASRQIAQYAWDFADGNTVTTTDAVVTHSYQAYGLYEVSLTVTDDGVPPKEASTSLLVNVSPSANFDLSLTRAATNDHSPITGEITALPVSETWIDEWMPFYVDVWVSAATGAGGVSQASLDLTYDPQYFTATSIEYGPAFQFDQAGRIDNAAGRVRGLGGTTLRTDAGDGQSSLLARVRFDPAETGPGVPIPLHGGILEPVVGLGLSVDYGEVDVAGIPAWVNPTNAPMPEIWPMPTDVDDDGVITFGDLSHIAASFNDRVDDPGSPRAWRTDFDGSREVNHGDLAVMAANFGRSRGDGTVAVHPAGFPHMWRGDYLRIDTNRTPTESATTLTQRLLAPVLDEGIARLESATGENLSPLRDQLVVEIVDLPGSVLGRTVGTTVIQIDADAAGYGWYADASPADDAEFTQRIGAHQLAAPTNTEAATHADLLTVIMHEIGHAMGRDHSDTTDVMSATLTLGTRRLWDELPSAVEPGVELETLPSSTESRDELIDAVFSGDDGF